MGAHPKAWNLVQPDCILAMDIKIPGEAVPFSADPI